MWVDGTVTKLVLGEIEESSISNVEERERERVGGGGGVLFLGF